MSHLDITISIVSYNSKNVLKNCISSIIETTKDLNFEIIVVDNSSEDGSSEFVKKHFPFITLIKNRENVGFGKAHNQSFRISKGRHFLILNPDTIVFHGAINKMVKFMDSNERVGVVGCKIFWDDEKNFMFPDLRIHSLKTALFQFTPFCRFFPNSALSKWYWKSAYLLWNSHTPISVEGITGGLMMVRREAFESVGLFDENFFLFFEEHDLLKRIKEKGWKIFYLPDAEIQHYFEESCRHCSFDTGKVYMQSALYYYKKHYRTAGYLLIKFLMHLTKLSLLIELKFTHKRDYREVRPENDLIPITWSPEEHAKKYLIVISYSPDFVERGGMFAEKSPLYLKSDILKRLPNETGFIRILPVYEDGSVGRVINTIKITKNRIP